MLVNNPMLSPLTIGTFENTGPAYTTPPVIEIQPTDVLWAIGMTYTFNSSVKDYESIQWYRNDVPYAGINVGNAEDLLVRFSPSDNGAKYHFVATNSFDHIKSNVVTATLRHRIYMNWSLLSEIQTSDQKLVIKFKDDGSIEVLQPNTEQWLSGVGSQGMPSLVMSDYQAKVTTLTGGEIDPTSPIKTEFVDMHDGISIIIDISSVPMNESRHLSIQIQDKQLPGFNWAGWDRADLFFRRISSGTPVITQQPVSQSKFPTEQATFSIGATE